MKLTITPITEADLLQISGWRYAPPYDFYNFADPPDAEMLAELLEPALAFHAIHAESGNVVGFCSFGKDGQVPGGDYTEEALDIGMGVAPDYTGRGLGRTFAASVIDFALAHYRPRRLRVTIAAFNERALRVWQALGFQPVAHFGRTGDALPFVILTHRDT